VVQTELGATLGTQLESPHGSPLGSDPGSILETALGTDPGTSLGTELGSILDTAPGTELELSLVSVRMYILSHLFVPPCYHMYHHSDPIRDP
jgi:hypothetical protein